MNRFVIIISILLVTLLTGRILLNTEKEIDNEMVEYVHNLKYDFSAIIDSTVLVNREKDMGFLVCKITKGAYNRFVEDSLNQHLVNYKRIRFLTFDQGGQFRMFVAGVSKYHRNDSIAINSNEDKLHIFRNGKTISESEISQSTSHKVYFAFWLQD